MSSESQIEAILERRKQIAAEIERLQSEEAELDVALRVFRRFGGVKATDGTADTGPKLGPPRPPGTPSLFDMTVTVLREAIASGRPGLKNREIVNAIGKRFWPGVEPRQILPPIYGFVKTKRLKKGSDGVFKPID